MVKNVNTFLRAVGTGAFHTGVEVYGKEWSFGFTNDGSSGIFSCPPQQCKTHAYREAVPMGETTLSQIEVEDMLIQLALDWKGTQYDVLRRNCTHFSCEFCKRLGLGPVPAWVGNIALAGRTVDIGIQRVASFRSMGTQSMATHSMGTQSAGSAAAPPRRSARRARGLQGAARARAPAGGAPARQALLAEVSQDLFGSVMSMQSMHTVPTRRS